MRGADLFIVQSLQPPGENLMELMLLLDAARRASANRITAVIPYFGYARQDRKEKPRVPITAKLISSLLQKAGANRILTMDLHAAQIQGFFDIPVDQLTSDLVFEDFLNHIVEQTGRDLSDFVVVSPDVGGVKRIEDIVEDIGISMAIVHKKREEPNTSKALKVIGDVEGKIAILRDDMIDTGGTLTKASSLLMENGAEDVYAFCTHALLSKDAPEKVVHSRIKTLGIADTIPLYEDKKCLLETKHQLKVISIAPLFAEAIDNIHHSRSVSQLFQNDPRGSK